jgi:hypothetical protein
MSKQSRDKRRSVSAIAHQGQVDTVALENNNLFLGEGFAFPAESGAVIEDIGRMPTAG